MATSNQKEVLFREISEYLKKYNVRSLLDIGAGDGVLAKKLASEVQRYLAIEENPERIQKLKSLGLEAMSGIFPREINETFDMVLSSHSIPETEAPVEPFIKKAWELVNKGGVLLVITFKGQRGELYDLRERWRGTENRDTTDERSYKTLLDTLSVCGNVEIHRAVSEFSSENLNETLELALSSINPENSKRADCKRFLEEYLKTKHFAGEKYSFPHEHLFISVAKNKKKSQ